MFAYHGVNEEEKQNGQNFELDVNIFTSVHKAGNTDNVNDTVSYSAATKTIIRTMQEKSYDLIEKAATRVAQQLLDDFSKIDKVEVTLKKPEAPMKVAFEYCGVNITRSRSDFYA